MSDPWLVVAVGNGRGEPALAARFCEAAVRRGHKVIGAANSGAAAGTRFGASWVRMTGTPKHPGPALVS